MAVASDKLYERMVNAIEDYAIVALDETGRVSSWNPGAERIKGYRAEEIVGRHFSVLYPPDDVAAGKPTERLERAARQGRVVDEGWRRRKDGSLFWAHVVISAMRDGNGDATGYAKVTREVPGAEQMQAVRPSERSFELLVQSVRDYAIILLDTEGRVTSWNIGAQRIKGYTADEIVGRSFEAFYPEEAVASGFPAHELEVAARDGRFEDENWRVRKDGSRYWANVIITALRNDQGELVGYAKVARDLTARRRAEEQAQRLAAEEAAHQEAQRRSEELEELNQRLRRVNDDLQVALAEAQDAREAAERATAAVTDAYRQLDQFAYVASHDLKAPLRGIGNLAQWIQDDLSDRLEAGSAEHLKLLQGRVARMEALIDGILAYSRAGRAMSPPETVDTAELVTDVIELIAVPETVKINVAPDMPTLSSERISLEQVFMNLITNAVKYSSAARSDPEVDIGWRDLGDAIEFSVRDNGPGISPEYHARIWGIFQTLVARDKVEGTGVGLAIVQKVVESRGGSVALESASGQGATFRFTWPKVSKQEYGV